MEQLLIPNPGGDAVIDVLICLFVATILYVVNVNPTEGASSHRTYTPWHCFHFGRL
jgi:hypothetical protein